MLKRYLVYRYELKNGVDYRIYTETEAKINTHGKQVGVIMASRKSAAVLILKTCTQLGLDNELIRREKL